MDPHVLDDLGPLYHDYRLFGVTNGQIPNFVVNQRVKEPILLGYIALAIGKSRGSVVDQPVSFAELFCADGYFTMLASLLGANPAVGIDSNRDGWSDNMLEVARRLGLQGVQFQQRDVNTLGEADAYDVVANLGGLYHVPNPVEILRKSWKMARKYLIVQTVVSMANDSETYFETPAPGWQHGSRYSAKSFINMLRSEGYRVIDGHFNVLEGNQRPEDRGSVYFLIEKT
ncbi:MAG TPA: methyltransferase domain-containing protein [Candidatus Baltobacteraceae bacterium]|jgi:hypothetical protein|nr:methyltransferase domain-containing protein [Candidatus Baltobacteraceae bacterium]